MREVNAAWAVLSNPGARELYDLERRLAAAGGKVPGPGRPGSQARSSTGSAPSSRVAGVRPDGLAFDPTQGEQGHPLIRGLLWVVILGVLAAIFVFTAYAANNADQPPSPSTTTVAVLLGAGDCVNQLPGAVDKVPCSSSHEATVEEVVPLGRPCPSGTREVYLPDQQESACLAST